MTDKQTDILLDDTHPLKMDFALESFNITGFRVARTTQYAALFVPSFMINVFNKRGRTRKDN